jgi:hypothetical protein
MGSKALWGVVWALTALTATALAGPSSALASPVTAPSSSPVLSASPAPLASPSAGAGSVTVDGVPFSFNADPFQIRELPLTQRPFSASSVTPREDAGIHDPQGVRMRVAHGRMYDFPRGQASYGLDNLNSYRITSDTFYLDRALAQAERLLSYHDVGGDAWYYPNYPSRSRHGRPGEFITAPYYSALPEGRILLFFSRLAEMTGEAKWREAADRTFAAFLRPGPRSDGPFILDIDTDGYYWLQEWPWPGLEPDCTLNGHNSSLFGLFEYYMVTRDERAAALFRAAVTTVSHYLPQFRRKEWISCYCLAHRGASANYHGMHCGQLLELYKMTGATVFAQAADDFTTDYPKPAVEGALRVEPGAYHAVKVDGTGKVIARRDVRVRRTATWSTTRRERLYPRSAIYLRAESGKAAGWWLPERSGKVYLQGIAEQHGYEPSRTVTIAAGQTLTVVRYDDQAKVIGQTVVDSLDGLTLQVDRRAVVNGLDRVRVSEGDLDGYWLPLRAGVRLD